MSITQRIQALKHSLPSEVTLVAVSKFHPVEALQEAYAAGQCRGCKGDLCNDLASSERGDSDPGDHEDWQAV